MLLFACLALARRLAAAAWVGAAGLAGHLAGQGLAFAVLLAAFAWLATVTRLGMAAASQKAYAVETRVNTLVPAVAAATTTANNAVPKAGGTVTGDLHIQGTLYGASGTLTCGDSLYVSQAMTADGTVTSHGALRGSSTTGQGGQGALSDTDADANMGDISGTVTTGNVNTIIHEINNLKTQHNYLASDMQATINRVNAILSAIG